jgi:hypothetical protein
MSSAWRGRADGRAHIGVSTSRERRTSYHQQTPMRSTRTRVCPVRISGFSPARPYSNSDCWGAAQD